MAVTVKKLKNSPPLSYFAFCNLQCIIYMGVSGPSLLIESTDSMIILHHNFADFSVRCSSPAPSWPEGGDTW